MERYCPQCKSTLQTIYDLRKLKCPCCLDAFGAFAIQFINAHNKIERSSYFKNKLRRGREIKEPSRELMLKKLSQSTPEKHLDWLHALYSKCIEREDYETCQEIKSLLPKVERLLNQKRAFTDALNDAILDKDEEKALAMKKKATDASKEVNKIILPLLKKFNV